MPRFSIIGLADPSQSIGSVIDDRYVITDVLGQGGMGAVFVAEHVKLRKSVAIKVIRPEYAGNGEIAVRFAREAMAGAQLDHPHIATALDYGTLPDGGAYLVMQLVRGRNLRALLETEKRLPWRRAVSIVAQVADALSAAHARGIIHRDLKPENIAIEIKEDGIDLVKVLDFGVASVKVEEELAMEGAAPGQALTRMGTVVGTPGYMAPEQAVGEQVGPQADLYALGVLLWECVTGRTLFPGDTLTSVVTKQLTEVAPPMGSIAPDAIVPEALEKLVSHMLQRRALDRPAKASEVRTQLQSILNQSERPKAMAATCSLLYALKTIGLNHKRWLGSQLKVALGWAKSHPAQTFSLGGIALLLLTASLLWFFKKETPQIVSTTGSQDIKITKPALPPLPAPAKSETADPKKREPMIDDMIKKLIHEPSFKERMEAAHWVEEHQADTTVPAYAKAVAAFELARGCPERKQTINDIVTGGFMEALPSLERASHLPRKGCGFLSQGDCFSCMRKQVATALFRLKTIQKKKALPLRRTTK